MFKVHISVISLGLLVLSNTELCFLVREYVKGSSSLSTIPAAKQVSTIESSLEVLQRKGGGGGLHGSFLSKAQWKMKGDEDEGCGLSDSSP